MSSTLSSTPRNLLKRENRLQGMHSGRYYSPGHYVCPRCRNPLCLGCQKCNNCGYCSKCGCNNSTPKNILIRGHCPRCNKNHEYRFCPYHKKIMRLPESNNYLRKNQHGMLINKENLMVLICTLFVLVIASTIIKLSK